MTASDAIGWARRVRSERPPAALDEYLAGFESFFNDYAGRVDYWRTRNPGYHEAIASLARFHVPRGARVFEVGSGPGIFKECAPSLVATDVVPGLSVDVRCDADVLPFRSASVGAIVMVDTLHHLPRPLDFLFEAARQARDGRAVDHAAVLGAL